MKTAQEYSDYRSQMARYGEVSDARIALAIRDGGWFCHYCGRPLVLRGQRLTHEDKARRATIDHKQPIALGGPNTLDNMVLACRACNKAKGKRPYAEYVKEIGR